MFFVSLSDDARILTSSSHEMSLRSGATWPTVFTQSRGDHYRKESGLIQPPSPPRYRLSPATGLSVVSSPQQIYSAALFSRAQGWKAAYLLPFAVTMKLLLSLNPRSFFGGRRRWWWREEGKGGQLHNTWAESSDHKSDPTHTLCLQADTCVLCFQLLACSLSPTLLLHFIAQINPINIVFLSFNAAIK